MDDVLRLAGRVIDRAARAAGELESYVEHREVTTVQAGTGGAVRHAGRADTQGVGVRAVVGERVGYASTSDVTDGGLDAVVEAARANAQVSEPDPAGAALPPSAAVEPLDGLCAASLTGLSMPDKIGLVTELARTVTSIDQRVRRLDTAQWRDHHVRVAVASTNGVDVQYESAFAELWCDALGEDAYSQAIDSGHWWGRSPELVDVASVAAEAVDRTTKLLGPVTSVRGADAVVLDPDVAGPLLDAVGRALTGGALGNRRSPFADRSGTRVAAEGVVLVDDGRWTGGSRAAPVDAEGVPRRRTPLIEAGLLVGAMHSTATAVSVGTASTGNARRSSHKSFPRAAPTVLRVAPFGSGLPVAGDAIYVQQLSGSGSGISAVTGRVSVGAIGYLMRGGERVGRLGMVPIATTLQSLLSDLESVLDDERQVSADSVVAPSLVWRPSKPLSR